MTHRESAEQQTQTADLMSASATPSWLIAGWQAERFDGLFAKLVTLNVPTMVVINGHAIAGGLLLALAHEFRITGCRHQQESLAVGTEAQLSARQRI